MATTYLAPPSRPAPERPDSYTSSYRSSYTESYRRDSIFSLPSAGSIGSFSFETPVIEEAKIIYITPKRPTLRNVHSLHQHYRLKFDRKNSYFSDDSSGDEDDVVEDMRPVGGMSHRHQQQQQRKSDHSPYSWYNRATSTPMAPKYSPPPPPNRHSMIVKAVHDKQTAPLPAPPPLARSATDYHHHHHHHHSHHERNPSLTSSGSASSSLYSSSSGDEGRISCETMSRGDTQELWHTMVELQDEYGCYNSTRMDAALEAENEAEVKELMPNRFVIDILNDSIQDLPPEAWDKLMRHIPLEDPEQTPKKKTEPKKGDAPPAKKQDPSTAPALKSTPAMVRRESSKKGRQSVVKPATPPSSPMSPKSPLSPMSLGSPISPKTIPASGVRSPSLSPSTSLSGSASATMPKKKSFWKRLQYSVDI